MGLLGWKEYRGFSYGQLLYYGQGAGTDNIGLSIVVAAWDSCCYGTRIEQAGSDIFHIKLKNKKKKIENTKNPALIPSFNSTRLSLASCPKSLKHTLGCCLCGFLFPWTFLFSSCFSCENQKNTKKKVENPKNSVFAILRFGDSHHVGSLGQLSTRSRPETRSSHWQKTAFLFVISTGFTSWRAFPFSHFYLIAHENLKKYPKKK